MPGVTRDLTAFVGVRLRRERDALLASGIVAAAAGTVRDEDVHIDVRERRRSAGVAAGAAVRRARTARSRRPAATARARRPARRFRRARRIPSCLQWTLRGHRCRPHRRCQRHRWSLRRRSCPRHRRRRCRRFRSRRRRHWYHPCPDPDRWFPPYRWSRPDQNRRRRARSRRWGQGRFQRCPRRADHSLEIRLFGPRTPPPTRSRADSRRHRRTSTGGERIASLPSTATLPQSGRSTHDFWASCHRATLRFRA